MIWQYSNDQQQWVPVDTDLMLKLMIMPVSQSMSYQRGKWNYTIKKVSAIDCIQTNLKAKMQRQFRPILSRSNINNVTDWNWNDNVLLHFIQYNRMDTDCFHEEILTHIALPCLFLLGRFFHIFIIDTFIAFLGA